MTRVVVDACVARSAGGDRSRNHPSPACTAALNALGANSSLQVAMSEVLRAEWRVHQTPFASRWLANLKARKRVAWLREPGPRLDILDAAVEVLTERQVEAVRDDLHVVELALSTDLRVLSDDRRQRELLVRLVERVPELGALAWVGAAMPGAPEWLGAGAPLGAPHRVSDGMTGA